MSELDDLDALLGEALQLADDGMSRPMAPPSSLIAEALPEPVAAVPSPSLPLAAAPAPPKDWLSRHGDALSQQEARVQADDEAPTEFEDAPL